MTATAAQGGDPGDVTLERLLQERLLRGARVLQGKDLLGRTVRWCHAFSDVELDADADLGSVAVLADGDELNSRQWADLARSDCAAVFVRPPGDCRPGTAPPDARGLVVIEVPATVHRHAVVELVGTLSIARQAHVLQYGQRVHAALAQLMHRGAGIGALCSRLAALSDCAVAILGDDLSLLAFDPGQTCLDPQAVTAALKDAEQQLASLQEPHDVAVFGLPVAGRDMTCLAGIIKLVEQRDGWVILMDGAEAVASHDIAEHRAAVEQAVAIVGTELLRVRGLERAEERARGNFVHALLHSLFSDHADLVARASHYRFEVNGRYGVIVAHSEGLIARSDSPVKLAEMAREAGRLLETSQGQTLTSVVGDVIAIVRPLSAGKRGTPDPAVKELRDFAVALDRRLSQRTQRPVLVAFGRPVTGADAIAESYREARIALELRQRLHVTEVCGFADLRVDSVLLAVAQQEDGREFTAEILDPLRNERDGGLVEVARVYVEAGGNLNEAARRLNVHRNTMLYKLDRITRLMQHDIRDPDTRFTIWLALRLNNLDETARRVNRDLWFG